jgi:hypothetical protein
MTHPVSPSHRVICYTLDGASGWYVKEPLRIAFAKAPERLKVEETRIKAIRDNGASEVIHGPSKGGKWQFFTGLIPTDRTGWYFGNDREERGGRKVNSLVIFRFSDNDRTLTVAYFPCWYIHNREERVKFVLAFMHDAEVSHRSPSTANDAPRPPMNSNGGI